ncbi:MAG: radical SAM family heme chaperone HemW [Christensenellales bacterium]|jgi:oxygen-independent coproporphyrinogen-3 oxidase
MRSAGLYIHIPFCAGKCAYCDFVSFAGREDAMHAYAGALTHEISIWAEQFDGVIDSVFFGGGTPSLMPPELISGIIDMAKQSFNIKSDAEISMESNPASVSEKAAKAWANAGVNRLSIGMQAAQDDLLTLIGRTHSHSDFLLAVAAAERAGIANLNVDIMYGLPKQSMEKWLETVDAAIDAGAAHVSCYALTLEEDTRLWRMVSEGLELPGDDEVADMREAAEIRLNKDGIARYEISNYARPGFECRHNIDIWRGGEYIGVGCAAHGFLRRPRAMRWANTPELDRYIDGIEAGVPEREIHTPDDAEAMFETMMLGLRLVEGIGFSRFESLHGRSIMEVYGEKLFDLSQEGLVKIDGIGVRLSRRGMEIQNTVLLRIMD